jgi:hypothetical protein
VIETAYPKSKSAVIRLIASLLKRLPVVKHQWKSYVDYFRCLKELALLGPEERAWMIRHNVISSLVNFYTDPDPVRNFNQRPAWGNEPPKRMTPPMMRSMAALLSTLVCSSETDFLPAKGPAPSQLQPALVKLGHRDRDNLLFGLLGHSGRDWFIPLMLKDRELGRYVAQIACHWSWEHPKLSRELIDLCIKGLVNDITAGTGELFRSYFRLFFGLLSLRDSAQKARIEFALPELFNIIRKMLTRRSPGDEKFLSFASKYLLTLCFKEPLVYDYMINTTDAKWPSWLNDYNQAHEFMTGGYASGGHNV